MASYKVELIDQKRKNELMASLMKKRLFEKKANIHGTCIKLLTDDEEFAEMWDENFKPMLDDIRPHGRVFCVRDSTKKLRVLYEPTSKTVIIKNLDYYGWLKSIALALVADFLEDFTSEHKRYSVHGSFVDHEGRGIALIGPPASGKTTLTYGLLLEEKFNFLTDDWFFVRLEKNEVLVFSAEKNSYIREDLASNWPRFKQRLEGLKKDAKGRSIVDLKKAFGEDRLKESSVLKAIILLERNKNDKPFRKLTAKQAFQFMVKNDFCNPHQLVRTKPKVAQRKAFFKQLFARSPVYLLNTIETPRESLERVRSVLKAKRI